MTNIFQQYIKSLSEDSLSQKLSVVPSDGSYVVDIQISPSDRTDLFIDNVLIGYVLAGVVYQA